MGPTGAAGSASQGGARLPYAEAGCIELVAMLSAQRVGQGLGDGHRDKAADE